MRITVDTSVLLRVVVADDEGQSRRAARLFESAEAVAVGLQTLAELVRVRRAAYGVAPADIADAVRALVGTETVVTNRVAVEAGLAVLEAGGDFSDGLIAHEGAWLGCDSFISFDERAVAVLAGQGHQTRLL